MSIQSLIQKSQDDYYYDYDYLIQTQIRKLLVVEKEFDFDLTAWKKMSTKMEVVAKKKMMNCLLKVMCVKAIDLPMKMLRKMKKVEQHQQLKHHLQRMEVLIL